MRHLFLRGMAHGRANAHRVRFVVEADQGGKKCASERQ
jgi:hypothetical protein